MQSSQAVGAADNGIDLNNALNPMVKMMMERRRRFMLSHEVVEEVHRQINRKKLRKCCTLIDKKTVECTDLDSPKSLHANQYTIASKAGVQSNDEQPYHNDPIMGQQRLRKRCPQIVKLIKQELKNHVKVI